MGERLSLRLRFFLFFAFIAAGAVVALVASGLIAARHAGPEVVPDLVLALGLAGFAIVGLCVFVWMKFDENVARPIEILSAEVRAALHAGGQRRLDERTGRYLGLLAPTAREVIAALAEGRARTEAAVVEATAEAARQKQRLETVLRDLEQGVVICGLDHRIRLYNRRALALLHAAGDLGLGRSLLPAVTPQPVRHSLQRLVRRFESGRHVDHPDGLAALLVTATADRARQLRGRMVLMLDAEGRRPAGYVVSFDDITNELSAGIWRDRLIQDVTDDMRQRVARLALAGEAMVARLPSDAAVEPIRRTFAEEPAALGELLQRLDDASGDLLAGAWPMANVLTGSLLVLVRDRRSESRDLDVEIEAGSLWVQCDSASVVDLLDRLMNRVAVYFGLAAFRLSTARSEELAFLDLAWEGAPVPHDVLALWLDERLDESLGPITGRDVLSRHKTDLWCQTMDGGRTALRLALPVVEAGDGRPPVRLPERPEFYDFDLAAAGEAGSLVDVPLKALTLVVFDTETTGLEPSRGDEIVQIAGVRIVNGRLLRGEVFDSYVDPKRKIPAAAARVHGITDAMVAGADPIERVLPRFHAFLGDAVLVAHNAAFDMTFVTRKSATAGVTFDNPVLDTVLLAAHLFGATGELTLDALAERFGVVIPEADRHTALGDSLATAQVLIRLFDLLEAEGVRTLGQALDVSERQVAIRRAQRNYQ